ncbi:MAG TPA: hypothetical protein VHA52_00960 [Candidatus Babeliaceae bacterium]|nr:hypothetical protein [Candidatus Babeliaceae bacterium]
MQDHFTKIIRNEKELPSPDSVNYTFLIAPITATKDADSISPEDFLSYNFLNKLTIANKQMSAETFFVNAFFTTKTQDTTFIYYSYPRAQLIGPKRIAKRKRKEAFKLSGVNFRSDIVNVRCVQFINFCRQNRISSVIYILPMLSRTYCISDDKIYTVDNMNIMTAQEIEQKE